MPSSPAASRAILSLGYEGRSVEDFVEVLASHRVEVLVDVRLTPLSRRKGFSKTALSDALAGAGIDYRHEPELGNPKENREGFRIGDRAAYERYVRQLKNGAAHRYRATLELAAERRIALMCFEREHRACHRSCITEQAAADYPEVRVLEA